MADPTKFIVRASGTSPFREVPLALTGLPKDEAGIQVHYLRKEIIPIGVTREHPDEKYPIHVTTDRAAKWVEAFKLMRDRGHAVPAPPTHGDRANSYGKWIDLGIERNERGGLSVFGVLKVVGDKAREDVAGKDVSICTVAGLADDAGNKYEEAAEHIAVTPYPALTGLSGWTSIAASRGHAVEDVPVFDMTAQQPPSETPTQTKESIMDLSALRKAIGAADTVPDADVISQASAKLVSIPTIEKAKTDAETALGEVRQELSRRPAPTREPDPDILADRMSLKLERVEHLVTTGAITEHQAGFIRTRIGKDNKPNALMLSRAPGADESPVDALLAFAAMKGEGVTADGKSRTTVQLTRSPHDRSDVTDPNAAQRQSEAVVADAGKAQGEAWKNEQLKARGLQPA